jgi:multiple sugar transport system permease protein
MIHTHRHRALTPRQMHQLRLGLLFASPWIVGLLVFNVYPILASLYYSLTDYDLINAPRFIGLGNYADLFLRDPLFVTALANTVFFAAASIILGTIVDVGIALLLNARVRGIGIYRTIFFLPSVVPFVAGVMVWLWMLNPQFGFVNNLLGLVNIAGPAWFQDPAWSKPALVLLGIWTSGQAIIIYLAAMQDVPRSLYEAAEIDGAGPLRRVINITLPMITPAFLFNVVIGIIGAFQYFTQAFIAGGTGSGAGSSTGIAAGAPQDSTLFVVLHLYNNAFGYLRMGYASAIAWVLTAIILAITLAVLRSSGRWVYYGGLR